MRCSPRCRAASTRRWRPPCSSTTATTSPASPCGSGPRPPRHGLLLGGRDRRRPAGGVPARRRPSGVDFTDEFEARVVAPYVADHAAGRTPNPCIECNRHLKFGKLLRRATALGFDAVATGHHARVEHGDAGRPHRLLRGADPAKDQSYVLYVLGQAELAHSLFPVGAPHQARGAGPGRRAWPRHRRQARQPGRVLRHHQRRPPVVPRAAHRAAPGPGGRPRRRAVGPGRRGGTRHRRPATGPGHGRRAPPVRPVDRPRHRHRRRRRRGRPAHRPGGARPGVVGGRTPRRRRRGGGPVDRPWPADGRQADGALQ